MRRSYEKYRFPGMLLFSEKNIPEVLGAIESLAP